MNPPSPPTRPKVRRGVRYAFLGLTAGFLGLGIAAYRLTLEAPPPPHPVAKEISASLSITLHKAAEKFHLKTPPTPTPTPPEIARPISRKLGLAATVFGFLGVVSGCASWLVGEHRRWTWAALCVSVAALAWTHVVVAVAIAIACAVGLYLLMNLG